MVGKLNSPGILVREVDATAFAPTIDSSIVGIVGFADKGPLNKATLITTAEQLVKVFGEPREALPGQGLLGALEILEATNRIYYVRVAGAGAVEASAIIPLGACPSVKLEPPTSIPYPFYLRVQATSDGQPLAASTVITVENTEGSFAANIIKYVGDGTADKDLFAAAVDPEDPTKPYIHGSFAGSSFQLSVQAHTESDFDGAGLDILQAVDKTGNVTGAPISYVQARGVNIYAPQLHYLVRSQHPGEGYNLGISLKTGEVTGISVETNNVAGQYFNIYVNDKGYQNESFRVGLVGDNTFIGTVIKSSEEETPLFSDFIKGEFTGSLNIDDNNPLISPAQKLSKLLTYPISSLSATTPAGALTASADPRFVKPLAGTYPLVGGKNGLGDDAGIFGPGQEGSAEDGTDDNLNTVVVGDPADKDGIYALDDDNLNISIALVPGFTNQRIQNALITLAESSQNFIAVVSPPYGLNSTQAAVNWVNGKNGLRTAAINSSYVAVYWPWVQVFSVFDEKDRWIDPAIYAARQMVYTDSVAEPWFAPAGFNRGRLTKPLDTEIILSQGDRDALYDSNINPMVKFFPEGITIFGQKTAKRIPSATDRINVRRLMIVLRKTLLSGARTFVFEPNDAITWENVKNLTEDILRDFAARRGVAEYRVICDATVNTPLRVSRRELWCKVILRPVEAAEYIIFEVNLTNNTSKLGA